jgi:hypothetical protein
MRSKSILLAALACLLLGGRPAAAHRLEPIFTEYASPFAPWTGSASIEGGHGQSGSNHRDDLGLELELGLLPRLQISFDQGHVWENGEGPHQRAGFENLETGLRYLVAGGKGLNYAVSLNPEYTFLSGSRSVREPSPGYGAAVHADYYGLPGFLLFSNVGWEQAANRESGESRDRTVSYHLAAVYLMSYRWNPTLELIGEQDLTSGTHTVTVVPEIQYYKNQWVEFKLGVPIQVNHGGGVGVQLKASFALGRGSHG